MLVSWIQYKRPAHVRHMHEDKCRPQEVGYMGQPNGRIAEQQGTIMGKKDEIEVGGMIKNISQ